MPVLEAIDSRKSIRAFTNQPVQRDTVEKILQISQRSPSGTNTQPWYVHVCTGEVKNAITEDVLALARAGKATPYEDHDYYPSSWKDLHRDRRRARAPARRGATRRRVGGAVGEEVRRACATDGARRGRVGQNDTRAAAACRRRPRRVRARPRAAALLRGSCRRPCLDGRFNRARAPSGRTLPW